MRIRTLPSGEATPSMTLSSPESETLVSASLLVSDFFAVSAVASAGFLDCAMLIVSISSSSTTQRGGSASKRPANPESERVLLARERT